VSYLYSLYDALVSIAVPPDKARAVVDAMEHDMGTTLATKPDLEILRRDVENRFALLDQKIDSVKSQLELKIDAQEFRMTVKLGSMMVVGFGLILAALRVWT
jgi:hypothetical protein